MRPRQELEEAGDGRRVDRDTFGYHRSVFVAGGPRPKVEKNGTDRARVKAEQSTVLTTLVSQDVHEAGEKRNLLARALGDELGDGEQDRLRRAYC
jgi:hypothetical protein